MPRRSRRGERASAACPGHTRLRETQPGASTDEEPPPQTTSFTAAPREGARAPSARPGRSWLPETQPGSSPDEEPPPMTTSFTAALREGARPTWDRAVGHRFVTELHEGTIADDTMAAYLIQDHRFLDSFLALLGGAAATASSFEARLRLSRFIGEVAGDENTYFLRAFDALEIGRAHV